PVHRPIQAQGDLAIERREPSERPVGELGGEGAVRARQVRPVERGPQREIREAAALHHAADHRERHGAGRRRAVPSATRCPPATRHPPAAGAPIGAGTAPPPPVAPAGAHESRSPTTGRCPRTNSAADIRRRPAGASSTARSAPLPVATTNPARSTSITVPGS